MRFARSFSFIILFCVPSTFLWAESVRAETQVAGAIHIHSSMSSGIRSILELAQLAREGKIDVLVITDLLCERYEYGVWPARSFFTKVIERNSILKTGVENYLKQIKEANEKIPEVLVIDAAVVTPFYYWTGNLWPGPLTLNNRGKDLLVMGLGNAPAYQNLPVLGNHKSEFNAYEGDRYALPYQRLIDHVNALGGLVFWSHPEAEEQILFDKIFFGTEVHLNTTEYSYDLVSTFRYTGFGIGPVELREIASAENKEIGSSEGLWDRILVEYCQGKRREPAWIMGEVDYAREGGSAHLGAILNVFLVKEKSREEILNSLRRGKLYVIAPDQNHTRRIVMQDFSLRESFSDQKAGMGEEITLTGSPILKLSMSFSDSSQDILHLILIRDGKILKQWEERVPFTWEFQDQDALQKLKSYYRIIAQTDRGDRLVSNPIFYRRSR